MGKGKSLMHDIIHMLGYILITVGVLFNVAAACALLRCAAASARLAVSTKALAVGTLAIIAGVVVLSGWSAVGVKGLVCLGFVIITAPVEFHALLRVIHKKPVDDERIAGQEQVSS